MPIRVLHPSVAARIAAGEVIERPASAVKELVENALDAGATRITVQIERGGVGLIRVVDDGHGIAPEELAIALQRHATSKLPEDGDLRTVTTLGFRGEALPSIAAVADVDVITRQPDRPDGAAIRVRNGAIEPVRVSAASPGTSFTARELFANQPARRKFMRTPAAEAAAVAQVAGHYALAYPEVAFTLTVDGRRSLVTVGRGDRRETAAAVLGSKIGAAMLDVAGGDPVFAVQGLVSPPTVTRGQRGGITLFVNRRWVQHRRLLYAVESAFDTLLMVGRHPIAVLDVTVDPAEIDVNVHPAKTEVRFRAESEAFRAVQAAVRAALVRFAPVPELAAIGGSAPPEMPGWTLPEPGSLPQRIEETWPQPSEQHAPPPRLVLPVMRVVGQVASMYVIAEGPDGMYLIDQHAAHERVLYERIAAARTRNAPDVQALLEPVHFEPTPTQAAVLGDYMDQLAGLGFALADAVESGLLIGAVPAELAGRDITAALAEYLDGVASETASVDRAERAAMTLACHAAVRAGKTLSLDEMRELVRLLEASESPRTCPHGRPTMVHVSQMALEREFGRR